MKNFIAIVVVLYATVAGAETAVPLLPKRPADLDSLMQRSKPTNYCTMPEHVKKQYCPRSEKLQK